MKQKIKNALLGVLTTCVFVGGLSLAPDAGEARERSAKSGANAWTAWTKQVQARQAQAKQVQAKRAQARLVQARQASTKQALPPKAVVSNNGWRNGASHAATPSRVAAGTKVARAANASPAPVRVAGTAQGSASWYGPGFHGKSTASGEKFDQNALTAAHPSLPFGTRVKVTNRNNGQSVVLRINDRGPFTGGRIIDLSKGAASAIGMVASGTAPVSLQIL